jgi:hypothetical protein
LPEILLSGGEPVCGKLLRRELLVFAWVEDVSVAG